MDIWERIRYARDRARDAEGIEKQRLADADTAELQQAASVRLATRQAVREALDDVLDEGGGAGDDDAGPRSAAAETSGEDASPASDSAASDSAASDSAASDSAASESGAADEAPPTGPSASGQRPEPSYAGAGTPEDADADGEPGSPTDG